MKPAVENTCPVLPVRDLAAAIAYYTGTLGFKLDWGGGPGSLVCGVSRGNGSLMLSRRAAIAGPVWVWIGLGDESLIGEYRARGVAIHREARNFPWAYEILFADPDGNILWLGAEPRKDQPFDDPDHG